MTNRQFVLGLVGLSLLAVLGLAVWWNGTRLDPAHPLISAVAKGRVADVQRLLAAGADVNARTEDGLTALHLAAAGEGTDGRQLAALLLDRGAEINAVDVHRGATPLVTALMCGRIAVAEELIARGADVNRPELGAGLTPLHIAAGIGSTALAEQLLAKGADLKAQDQDGATPLHMAAREGKTEMVAFLLQKGADVNARMGGQETPLHVALSYKHPETAACLRDHGGKE